MNFYKKYEISLSQNGPNLFHIARNSLGNVVFRELTEEKLKKAIDRSIEEKERQVKLYLKKVAELLKNV